MYYGRETKGHFPVKKRRLGNSAFFISAIGLGCWQFSKNRGLAGSFWGDLADDTITSIIEASLRGGVDWFDTAELYGHGMSERMLSSALQRLNVEKEKIVVATKWNPVLRSARSIVRTFPVRERYLAPYPITLLQVHNPFSVSPIEDQMRAMAFLVESGKVGLIGVSNFSLTLMRKAHETLLADGFVLTSNQMRYNLLDRSVEFNGVLDYAREHDITLIAYSPLAQGLLTGRFHEEGGLIQKRPGFRRYLPAFQQRSLLRTLPLIQVLRDIAERHQKTPAQIALRWIIQFHGEAIVAIPGASSVLQAQQNAAVMDFELTEEELAQIDETSLAVARRS